MTHEQGTDQRIFTAQRADAPFGRSGSERKGRSGRQIYRQGRRILFAGAFPRQSHRARRHSVRNDRPDGRGSSSRQQGKNAPVHGAEQREIQKSAPARRHRRDDGVRHGELYYF